MKTRSVWVFPSAVKNKKHLVQVTVRKTRLVVELEMKMKKHLVLLFPQELRMKIHLAQVLPQMVKLINFQLLQVLVLVQQLKKVM